MVNSELCLTGKCMLGRQSLANGRSSYSRQVILLIYLADHLPDREAGMRQVWLTLQKKKHYYPVMNVRESSHL